MQNSIKITLILFSILAWVTHGDAPIPTVQLDKIYDIQLGANDKFTFQIEIPFKVTGKPNLYISAYSPINDPYQQPTLNIISNDYKLTCDTQSSDLNSVCFIPSSIVERGKKFRVEALCQINCEAKLVAYLSQTLELDLNEQVKIVTKNSPIEKMIKLSIPNPYDFTEIELFINVKNQIQVNQGVEMYINCGRQSLSFPSKNNHQNIRIVSWGENKAAILKTGNQLNQGDTVYILITVGTNTSLTFQSRVVRNGTRYLQLNQYYYDWLQYQQRLYVLNLTDIDTRNLTSIYIELTQFAGSPVIEVSFDKQFTTKEISQSKTFNLRFQITPQMMQSSSFKKVIFVRMSSSWSATYSLYSRFKYNDSDSIQIGVSQYVEVKANQIGVLIYDHIQNFQKQGENKTVQIKIENEGGVQSNIRIFTCKEILLLNCKINKTNNNLSTLPANFKQLIIQTGKQTVKANYSNNNCLGFNPSIPEQYFCVMVIVLIPKDTKQIGKYSVAILDQSFIIPLSEGKSRLSSVNKQQYIYFSFYLPEKEPVMEVFFFVNTLDGLTKMFASTELPKPTMDTTNNSKIKVGTASILFNGSQIRSGMYYLTVYGYEFSDFVVNVIVRRIDMNKLIPSLKIRQNFVSQTQISQIQLTEGIGQIFVIQVGKNLMKFIFKSLGIGKINLKITQIVGKVITYITIQTNHSRIICQMNQCEIDGQQWQSYLVEVIGNSLQLQRFSIVFRQIKQCYTYPLGTPVYINLDKNDIQCLQYTINKSLSFQISSSLTNIQILNEIVEIIVIFQNNTTFLMTTNTYIFQHLQLNNNCLSTTCKIIIKYISFDQSAQFQTITQRIDGVITLYDGVIQKIDTTFKTHSTVYYRYPLDFTENIEIFVISQTYCTFNLYATLVEEPSSQLISNYPNSSTPSNQSWKVTSSIDSPTLTMVPISKAKMEKIILDKQLRSPYLLISVYGELESSQNCTYSIEVTQKERILREGDQQIGFLQPKQVVSYEVYPSQMSLLSIRSLYKDKCYKLVDDKNYQLKDNILIQSPKTIPIYYHIRGNMIWSCMYQISLQNFQDSIITVVEGFPTKVVIEYNEVTYLLYKHITNQTFKIYQFIEGGSARIYATPLSAHQLENGLKNIADQLSLSSYKYRDNFINNLQIQPKQNSTDYCFDCFYLIAIRGDPSVQEEVVLARKGTPITIREHSFVDSELDANQSETFIYYSALNSNWSLSVDVVHGSLNVTIKDMQKNAQENVIRNEVIRDTNKNIVSWTNFTFFGKIPTNSLDQSRKYKIEIIGLKQTVYHLQIIKYSGSYRIAQGITSKITMPVMGKIDLQFDNNLDNGLIEVNIEAATLSKFLAQTKVYYSPDAYIMSQNQTVVAQYSFSGNIVTISFNGKKGHYSIRISSFLMTEFDMIVLMPRPGLSELRAGHPTVSKKEVIYQLYTDDDNYAIIQIFPCQGNIKIRGADNPAILSRGQPSINQIQLLHQNVGGHFIVTSPKNISGEYFIRVQNKQYEANIKSQASGIAYMIQYRTLRNDELNPYDFLDADSYQTNIDYQSYSQYLLITLANIKSLNQNLKIKVIHYTIAIGFSPNDVKNYLFCAPTISAKHLSYAFQSNIISNKFNYKVEKKQILKSGITKDAYIGVTAMVTATASNGKVYSNLKFLYQPAYLGKLKESFIITQFGLFQLVAVIFFVLGSLTITVSIISYLIKVWRGYNRTNQLVQQVNIGDNNNNNNNFNMSIDAKGSQFEISVDKQENKQTQQFNK